MRRDLGEWNQHLAWQLEAVRKRAGLSSRKACQIVDVSQRQFQRYETGEIEISAIRLKALAEHFGLSLEDFFRVAADKPGVETQALTARQTRRLILAFESIANPVLRDATFRLVLAAAGVSYEPQRPMMTKPGSIDE